MAEIFKKFTIVFVVVSCLFIGGCASTGIVYEVDEYGRFVPKYKYTAKGTQDMSIEENGFKYTMNSKTELFPKGLVQVVGSQVNNE